MRTSTFFLRKFGQIAALGTIALLPVLQAIAAPTFTGHVPTDFPAGDNTLIVGDIDGLPLEPTGSGWDMKDLRLLCIIMQTLWCLL